MVSLVSWLPVFFVLQFAFSRRVAKMGRAGNMGVSNYRFIHNKSESKYLNSQAEHSQSHECLQSYLEIEHSLMKSSMLFEYGPHYVHLVSS